MSKKAFLNELDYHLRRIPQADRRDMLHDFEEHFQLGITDGKSEEEVAFELGNPKTIARDLLADYQVNQVEVEKDTTSTNLSRSIIATIFLTFFNLIFVLGPALAIVGVYVAVTAIGIVMILSPLAWIESIMVGQTTNIAGEFFIVLSLCSLGVLLSIGMIYVGKLLYRVLSVYIKFNVRIVKG